MPRETVMSVARASTSIEVDGSFSAAGISFITPKRSNALQRRRREVVSPRLKSRRTTLIGYGIENFPWLGAFAVFVFSRQPTSPSSERHASPRRRGIRNLDEQPAGALLLSSRLGEFPQGEARRTSHSLRCPGREGGRRKRFHVLRQQKYMVCR